MCFSMVKSLEYGNMNHAVKNILLFNGLALNHIQAFKLKLLSVIR